MNHRIKVVKNVLGPLGVRVIQFLRFALGLVLFANTIFHSNLYDSSPHSKKFYNFVDVNSFFPKLLH